MRRPGRSLTPQERALWRAYAETVKPLPGHALPSLPAAPVEPAPPVPVLPAPAPPCR